MDGRYVAYYRVSTAKQGTSGLGLDAQKAAALSYLNGGTWELAAEFTDIESGKHADRPELRKAMDLCKLIGARLLIAKLDRLSRNVHFLSGLMERGIDFVACDMPTANKLTVHIMAAVAEQEREAVSARTKAGLQSIKQRILADGTYLSRGGNRISRLGNPKPSAKPDHIKGTQAVKAKADEFAARVAPTIQALRATSVSLETIANELNRMGVRSPRGAAWTATGVKRILDRTARQSGSS